MLLELKNVCYTYNKDTSFSVNALENINLQIPEGQFVGVIGHTGSGKSTLIQHFNGLIRPTNTICRLFAPASAWSSSIRRTSSSRPTCSQTSCSVRRIRSYLRRSAVNARSMLCTESG